MEQVWNNIRLYENQQNVRQVEELLLHILQNKSLTKEEYLLCAEGLAAKGCDSLMLTAYCHEVGRDGSGHSYVVTWKEIETILKKENIYEFKNESFIKIEATTKRTVSFHFWNTEKERKLIRTGCFY